MADALTQSAPCTGPCRCGVRVPGGVNKSALVCRYCDGPQLVSGELLPRPPEGYDRSQFSDGNPR